MAVHKAKRSNPSTQPRPQQAKTGLAGGPSPQPQQAKIARVAIPDRAKAARSGNPGVGDPKPQPQSKRRGIRHLKKAQIFDVLHHLNRGYCIALVNLGRLERGIFPHPSLRSLRHRTEELRAAVNHELLAALAGREQRDALRFRRLHTQAAKTSTRASGHK